MQHSKILLAGALLCFSLTGFSQVENGQIPPPPELPAPPPPPPPPPCATHSHVEAIENQNGKFEKKPELPIVPVKPETIILPVPPALPNEK